MHQEDNARVQIAVVGAGIGGLAVAIALRARGLSVTVFERAPEMREVGAGILLSPNGVSALESLGLREAAQPHSRVIREWRILDPAGRILRRMRPIKNGRPAFSLHRADLQKLLLAQLDLGVLKPGHELSSCRSFGTGVNLHFVNGGDVCADALIGADGLRSAVRTNRFGSEAPRYSGYVVWRGVAPFIPLNYEGEYLSESWGEGKRFGIAPMGHGRCYWFATSNVAEAHVRDLGAPRELLLSLFRHWHSPVQDLIRGTADDQMLTNAIYDRPPRQPWSDGPITLLGDAAHPMTPNLGQGACCALEDAVVLARALDRARNIPDAFSLYARSRASRTAAIQRASWLLGKFIQLESPWSTGLRQFVFRLTPNALADASMGWLFRFTP